MPPRTRTNLTDPLTPLLGRHAELEALEQLLQDNRLVTLWGPAGVGKTRLALAFATELPPARYPGGIWHLDVQDCTTLRDVGVRLLRLFSLPDPPVQLDLAKLWEQVASTWRQGSLLLILDNVEACLEPLAEVLDAGLRTHTTLHALVTSRERLRLRSQVCLPLQPLPSAVAVELFSQRLRAASGQSLEHDPVLLHALVQRLDLLPLAIELAAVSAGALQPAELFSRLEPSLPYLTLGERHGPGRARGMREALASTYARLTEDERHVLLHCAQFRGAFELHEVESLLPNTSCVALVLTRLWECSLLRAEIAHGTQFTLYRAAREYVLEQSGGAAQVAAAHFAEHMLALARENLADDSTEAVILWLGRHAETFLTLAQAAWQNRNLPATCWAVLAASHAAILQGPVQPLLQLCEVLALDEPLDAELRSRVLLVRARLRTRVGAVAQARKDFDAALSCAPPALAAPNLHITLHTDWGNSFRHHGQWELAQAQFDQALALSAAHYPKGRARVLSALASMEHERGDLQRADHYFQQALLEARQHAMPLAEATVLQNHGILLQEMGQRQAAVQCFSQALRAHQHLGNRRFEAIAQYDLATLALQDDAPGLAQSHLRRALLLGSEVGDRREWGLAMALLAVSEALMGELDVALAHLNSAQRVLEILGQPGPLAALHWHRVHLELAAALHATERGDNKTQHAKLDNIAQALAAYDEQTATAESDETRYARRLVSAGYARFAQLQDQALVALDGGWFQLAGRARVDLSHRAPLQRLLQLLIQQRVQAPNEPVTVEQLIQAGWPEQKSVTKAGKNRLHVAITTLRKAGLDAHLIRSVAGYWLKDANAWSRSR